MTTTHWVKPPAFVTGQDHLATRAVCEHLYGRLIPGITNVTDRARYYSFYPWLLWALDESGVSLGTDAVIDHVRRAECLLSLIGIAHGHEAHSDGKMHGDRLVGSDTLRPVAERILHEDFIARLSDYAHRDPERAATRYFKNPLGGLGQYYRGSLELLHVLSRDVGKGVLVGYTQDRGRGLAEAMDEGVDRCAFLSALRGDTVDGGTLKRLAGFCPCQINAGSSEHKALVDLFTERPGSTFASEGKGPGPRRLSLGLLLDLAGQLGGGGMGAPSALDETGFRAAVYSGALPGGGRWSLPARLEEQRVHWAVYQRNELLSLAVQALFWAGLTDPERPDPIPNAQAWGTWMSRRFSASIEGADELWSQVVDGARSELPVLSVTGNPSHEIALAATIRSVATGDRATNDQRERVVTSAFRVLIALCARDNGQQPPYQPFALAQDYLGPYPINLVSLRYHSRETWRDLTTRETLAWLGTHWGVTTHLRVALRKLRQQSTDTFRVRPADQGLIVAPFSPTVVPAFGSPRFQQAAQVLQDLGALSGHPTKPGFVRTEFGCMLAEALHG